MIPVADNSTADWKGLPQPTLEERGAAPAAGEGAGRRWRRLWTATAAAAAFVLIVLGIIIKIHTKDGQDMTMTVPPGSTLTVQEEGKSDVVISGQGEERTGTAPAAATGQAASLTIEAEPIAIKPGAPLSAMALAIRPASIRGAQSWTFETRGHRGPANSLAFDPQGRWLASGGADGTIRVWDPSELKLLRILIGHDGSVTSLSALRPTAAISPPRAKTERCGSGTLPAAGCFACFAATRARCGAWSGLPMEGNLCRGAMIRRCVSGMPPPAATA